MMMVLMMMVITMIMITRDYTSKDSFARLHETAGMSTKLQLLLWLQFLDDGATCTLIFPAGLLHLGCHPPAGFGGVLPPAWCPAPAYRRHDCSDWAQRQLEKAPTRYSRWPFTTMALKESFLQRICKER